ncbi:MAG: hypothetical protein KDD94_09950 [Calditrichaeota bacterium]|nr:hypothetical protein [Calditrichota bacterium]
MKIIYSLLCLLIISCFSSPRSGNSDTLDDPNFVQKISITYSNNHQNPHTKSTMVNTDVEHASVKTYLTTGSDHYHLFKPSPNQMSQLREGIAIQVSTEITNNHFHVLTIEYDPDKTSN